MEQFGDPTSELVAPDPRRLLIFRAVARRGSMSAAAASLGWTQPAVAQHLQRLERELGIPLVLRSSRGVTLTEAGARLLSHADAVASRLAVAGEEMEGLRTMRKGRLRIAAFPSAAAMLVPPALARVSLTAPDLDVRLSEMEPPEAVAALLAGDAELALIFHHPGVEGDADDHPDLVVHRLREEPVFAVLPPSRHGADRGASDSIELADLAGERWIAGCRRCRTHLDAVAAGAGFQPDVRHTTDDYVVVQNLVAADLGVALLPALALAAAPNPGVVPVRVRDNPVRHISVAHRRETAGTPAVRAALEALALQATHAA